MPPCCVISFFYLCDVLLSPGTRSSFRCNHILTVHDKVQRQFCVRACQGMLGRVVLQLTSHMLAGLNLAFVVRNVDRRTCLTPASRQLFVCIGKESDRQLLERIASKLPANCILFGSLGAILILFCYTPSFSCFVTELYLFAASRK